MNVGRPLIVKNLAKNHPLIFFYSLSTILSAVIWFPLVLFHTAGDATSGSLWWIHYVGGLGPAIGAIVTSLLLGNGELKRLIGRITLVNSSTGWIVLGASLPIILLLIINMMIWITSGNWIKSGELLITDKLPGLNILSIAIVEIVFFGFGEEMGWRGFAWPRLRDNYGFLVSASAITLPWVIWHVPTFLYNDNMVNLGLSGTIGWIFSLFTGAIILGWLVDSADGNILPAVFFHGILDVVFVSRAVAGKYDSYLGAAVVILSIVITLLYVRKSKKRSSYKPVG